MRFLLAALFAGSLFTLKAQENHFIYLQTEDQQSFYLRDQDALNASSESGFIIMPRVPKGIQSYVIGFPKNQWPPHQFYIEMNNRDRGFVLKIIDSKAWGLVDLQSSEIIIGTPLESIKKQDIGKQNLATDAFSVLLSKSVDDPQLLDQNLIRTDSLAVKEIDQLKVEIVKDSVKNEQPAKPRNNASKNLIEQIKVNASDSLLGKKVYVDKVLNDTITVEPLTRNGLLGKITDSSKSLSATDKLANRCASLATDVELQTLRRKLLLTTGEDNMHAEAIKAISEKCYSTRMFRSIANVFTTDKGRIKLMEAAYTLVYDPANFAQLEILLSDSASMKRFQELIKSK